MPKYKVIRDTKEKKGHGWTFGEDEHCLGMDIFKLKTGDYSIEGLENVFTIERKGSTAEVAMNVNEERFEKEFERLEEFKYPFMVCEFTYDDIFSFPRNSGIPSAVWPGLKVSAKYLLMKLISYQARFKTKIILAGDNSIDVANMIFKTVAFNEFK